MLSGCSQRPDSRGSPISSNLAPTEIKKGQVMRIRSFQSVVVLVSGATLGLWSSEPGAQMADTPALQLEAKIPLGNVSGRIDHMAIDPARQRLFVAELGNNSVGIVDLNGRRVLRAIEA